ncbi:FAD-dependent oxidoreductase [Kibdelosporangium aridum]|uniref:FAD-dependent oxidoreductase n=1 Tax=Kibdelosporangium aridum TaxID=2030 RepID=UPI0035E4A2FF
MTDKTQVLVVGSGISGLTSAVYLAERGHAVTVVAREPAAESTSVVAAAITGGPAFADPAVLEDEWAPGDLMVRWHRAGLTELTKLADAPGSGVRLGRGRLVSSQPGTVTPEWEAGLPGYRLCDEDERAGFPLAFEVTMPVVDMRIYLDYLVGRLRAAGGRVETGELASVADAAAQSPVVVNCTGAHARTFAGDESVFAVRGQHVIVANPGIEDFLFEFSKGPRQAVIVPHADRVVLGTTADKGQWSLEPDEEQTEHILRRSAELDKRLAGAEVLGVEVGLRAGRPTVRLEAEKVGDALVVHNYGHGGVALGLSWGCAADVAALIERS